jgi:hypothetical protein
MATFNSKLLTNFRLASTPWITKTRVSPVAGAVIEIHAYDKRIGFGRAISGHTRQEFSMHLECRYTVRRALLYAGQNGLTADRKAEHRPASAATTITGTATASCPVEVTVGGLHDAAKWTSAVSAVWLGAGAGATATACCARRKNSLLGSGFRSG